MSTTFQQAARDAMLALVEEGGAYAITYRRQSGETISTYGVKDKSVDEFSDFQSSVSEWREAWDLLVEDIGDSPCRGDALITADGKNWIVQDILETASDEEVVRVTVK